jgi:hypothetical protein
MSVGAVLGNNVTAKYLLHSRNSAKAPSTPEHHVHCFDSIELSVLKIWHARLSAMDDNARTLDRHALYYPGYRYNVLLPALQPGLCHLDNLYSCNLFQNPR